MQHKICMLKHQKVVWILKGFAIGVALLIPGLSAGTLALIMGIYEKTLVSLTKLISFVRSFFLKQLFFDKVGRSKTTDKQAFDQPAIASPAKATPIDLTQTQGEQENFWFLLCLSIGAGGAIFLMAQPLSFLLSHFSIPLHSFFMGLIIAGLPPIFKMIVFAKPYSSSGLQIGKSSQGPPCVRSDSRAKSVWFKMTKNNRNSFLWIAFWTVFFWLGFEKMASLFDFHKLNILYIPENPNPILACLNGFLDNPLCSMHTARTLLFLSGFLAVFASVLPGLSGSFVLWVIGTYPFIMSSLTEKDFLNLAFFSIGGVLGLLLALYVVRLFLKKHRRLFFCIALGMIIAGLPQFMPDYQHWPEVSLSQWAQISFFAFLGSLLFFLLNHMALKNKTQSP